MSHKANDIVTEDLAEEMVEKLFTEYGQTLDNLEVDEDGVYYFSESDSGSPSDVGYNVSVKKHYLDEELGDLITKLELI